jgi:hypothetical protein
MRSTGEGGTLLLETADGGRVRVDFADDAARTGSAAIEAAARITRPDGPAGELEGVIVAEATRLGLTSSIAGARRPTTIVVQSTRPMRPTSARSRTSPIE